ncbi:hypothetical protein [Streptomyces rubradiris]|uniref:Uncharacterized protein n=1 Tax=Streptomyces rubradiris TaxID=285531 RepID=A0ABQ3R3N1_STRRR|nr:hypothetical protein [Streptomyces rubradiris]GHH30135.1 hypothetical protein GCM10018792_76210 [Streptomyces rubradiris]GHI50402.1 hypothetical protein Srubr_02480 [Streptomyces rubradiris]
MSTQQPSSINDGTPTRDHAAALHWAAVALGLAEARAQQGNPLTDDERTAFDRYQAAAHGHGFSNEQIRCYLDTLRPAVTR